MCVVYETGEGVFDTSYEADALPKPTRLDLCFSHIVFISGAKHDLCSVGLVGA